MFQIRKPIMTTMQTPPGKYSLTFTPANPMSAEQEVDLSNIIDGECCYWAKSIHHKTPTSMDFTP
jgi:hypothetical protein